MIELAVPRSGGEMHEADRLLRRAAARPGNACDGNHDIGIGVCRARRAPSPSAVSRLTAPNLF